MQRQTMFFALVALFAAFAAGSLQAQVNGNPNQGPLPEPPLATWPQDGNDPGQFGANVGSSNVQNGYEFECLSNDVVVTRMGVCTPNNQRVSYTSHLWHVGTQTELRRGSTAIERGWAWSTPGPIRLQAGENYIVTGNGSEWFYLNLATGSTQPQNETRTVWNPQNQYIRHVSARNAANASSFPDRPATATQDYLWGAADIEYYLVDDLSLTVQTENAQRPLVFSTDKGEMAPSGGYLGVSAGSFTVTTTNQPYCKMMSVTVSGVTGTANLNAVVEPLGVGLFRDSSGGQPGVYDEADIQIDSWKTFANINNGTATFDVSGVERDFANDQSKRYFIVVKLNGTANPGEVIRLAVTDVDCRTDITDGGSGTTIGAGINAELTGLEIDTPAFVFSNVDTGTRLAYTGSSGNVIQAVDVEYPAGATGSLMDMTFTASGTGDDVADLSTLQLYLDSNNNGTFEAASDNAIDMGTFSGNNGTVTFNLSGGNSNFAAGTTKRFFLVTTFGNTPSEGDTFMAQVTSANAGTANVQGTPAPATPMGGVEIAGNGLYATVNGPSGTSAISNDSSDQVLMDLSLAAVNEGWNAATMEFTASGTLDANTDVSSVELWEDTNGDGSFSRTNDTLATATGGGSFSGNTFTATLTNGTFNNSLGNPNNVRRFFLVASFGGTGGAGETLTISLSDAPGATRMGGGMSNLQNFPTPGITPVEIGPAQVVVTYNGPTMANVIDNDSNGPNNNGEVMLDFSLEGFNESWTINTITFRAAADDPRYTDDTNLGNRIESLDLWEDLNNNGTFDGIAGDARVIDAAHTGGFNTSFQWQATLSAANRTLDGTTGPRRFFLTAKFTGVATPQEYFSARLESIGTSPAGTIEGAPTANGAGLLIDASMLTIAKSPLAPADDNVVVVNPNGAATSVIGSLRFSAVNADLAVARVDLTLSGNGDWMADLDDTDGPTIPNTNPPTPEFTGTGVQFWIDENENGTLEEAFDTRIFSSEATSNTELVCNLSPALLVPNGGYKDLLVVLNVKDGVAGATPTTFHAEITDVTEMEEDLDSTIILGTATEAPQTSTLNVLNFSVDSITPTSGGQGTEITLTGSGLVNVVQMTIAGQICGTANLMENPNGMEVMGFTAPAGSGSGREIVLTTSLLGAQTLTQTWTFSGGGGGGGSSGCVVDSTSNSLFLLLMVLGLAGAAVMLRRREA